VKYVLESRSIQLKRSKLRHAKLAITVGFFAVAAGIIGSNQITKAGAPLQSAAGKNPLKPNEQNTALGLDHFNAHCATCHAASGKADSEKGKAVKAADLTNVEVQSKTDGDLFNIISRGVPGTAMPSFSGTHTPDEIWQLVLFLRRLPKLTTDDRLKLEKAVPPNARHHHDADHDEADHQMEEQPQAHEHAASPAEQAHEHRQMQHSTSGENDMHGAHDMTKTLSGGPFKAMQAIGSGTSLMPSASQMYSWHWMKNDWMIMAHGDLKVGFDHQGDPRGINKAESQNWFMLMAQRDAGPGQLLLRGMFSAEPWTAPRRGFPELFQTGETFEGRAIIDAQHPHDLFMELAAAYNVKLSEHVALNFYGGPVGEPALGPTAFMHRMSASENPAAPLGHHWQDSTHITHGVITAGVTAGRFRIESSLFHGAEPDENRKDIEMGKLDSWSGRVWFTPTPDWSMQFSYGHLVHPEILEPGNLKRMTASISHNRSWGDGNWSTSVIWGRNHEPHGNSNSYLFESTANFLDKNYLYTRVELVDKQGLLEENIFGRRGLDEFHSIGNGFEIGDRFDQFFRAGAFTFGGVRDVLVDPKLRIGIGADVTFYHVPTGLDPIYGSSPTSFHVFIRIRPGKAQH